MDDLELTLFPRRDVLGYERAILSNFRIGLCNCGTFFVERRKEIDFVRELALGHLSIRRFNEAHVVDASKGRKRCDQTNVRAFRRFNRTNAAIVTRVHIAHFEARAFAG